MDKPDQKDRQDERGNDTNRAMRTIILEAVDESSGGIKGLELFTKMLNRHAFDADEYPGFDFEKVIRYIRSSIPELRVLRYGMKLSDDMVREKYFIYRPLTPPCSRCGS